MIGEDGRTQSARRSHFRGRAAPRTIFSRGESAGDQQSIHSFPWERTRKGHPRDHQSHRTTTRCSTTSIDRMSGSGLSELTAGGESREYETSRTFSICARIPAHPGRILRHRRAGVTTNAAGKIIRFGAVASFGGRIAMTPHHPAQARKEGSARPMRTGHIAIRCHRRWDAVAVAHVGNARRSDDGSARCAEVRRVQHQDDGRAERR